MTHPTIATAIFLARWAKFSFRATDNSSLGLFMPRHKGWRGPHASWRQSDASFSGVREQLAEYFAGERRQFDVPIKLGGTPFQQRVWEELTRIPFGETITYGQLAQRVGKPTASRAVGHANGPQSALDHRAVPSRHRRRRKTHGLRRRRRQEAVVTCPGNAA